MTTMTTQRICPRCTQGHLLRSYDELLCSRFCGYTEVIISTTPSIEAYIEEPPVKPLRRIHGISARESRRIYRNTPAGRAAWNRYRYSNLFYEAHARHRRTQKYKDTQVRYHEKIKLFRRLLKIWRGEKELESTCPLNLFYKGPNDETYHNRQLCNFDGEDCTLTCLETSSEGK